jgi:ActR/RegA family two-component response regulator
MSNPDVTQVKVKVELLDAIREAEPTYADVDAKTLTDIGLRNFLQFLKDTADIKKRYNAEKAACGP